ncbi:MAG: pantoate--beta-alanine ligase [Chromatiales bacterium]|jgi:pantoate--beta-alanine ligase|nr:pantoate--beta-alanine ligase [Chromatiales bacterium]
MRTVHRAVELRAIIQQWRAAGEAIAFVPTMGDLHAGHLALIAEARRHAARVVISIFVNPLQFNDAADFAAYPRSLERDVAVLAASGGDLLFAPDAREIYPHGMETGTRIEVPVLAQELCGAFRPGHFTGVATVVAILFNLVRPDIAIFGEKDYQQLLIVRRMSEDLRLDVDVRGMPTVREADGLAMSSRNRYLSAEERGRAPVIYRTLEILRARLLASEENYAALEAWGMAALFAAGLRPEYVAVRRAQDLQAPNPADRQLRLLVAAWLGSARLIDNLAVDC